LLGLSVGASKDRKVNQKKQVTLRVTGRDVSLSNLDKVMYTETGFTKGQVIDYYTQVARYILPHLKDRPITLKRFPNGINGEYFYEKMLRLSHRIGPVKNRQSTTF
jgi:bifunctional non-homologous end joining protein LigD